MRLADLKVLLDTHSEDAPHHATCRDALEALINGPESFGFWERVLSGFRRVVTHPKVFARPKE